MELYILFVFIFSREVAFSEEKKYLPNSRGTPRFKRQRKRLESVNWLLLPTQLCWKKK
jgi:hypothetical protein